MKLKTLFAGGALLSIAAGLFLSTAAMRTPAEADPGHPHGGACSVCFTCGTPWKKFAGSWSSANFGATERGSACAGAAPAGSGDTAPFLCCK